MTFTASAPCRKACQDAWILIGLALSLRLGFVAWGASRFPPAGDGQYYHVVAERIARGLGYTWSWPDGAVTYAAHYPVGYPGMLGVLYASFGTTPTWAMLLNAASGTIIVWAVHRIAVQYYGRRAALVAACIAMLHPTFLFYTPAVMTEQVSAALTIGAAALVLVQPSSRRHRWCSLIAIAALSGIATLVRPQQLLFAPFLGFLFGKLGGSLMGDSGTGITARSRWLNPLLLSAIVTCLSVGVCLPWTWRNCERMGQCVFVSANGGWNLMIGTSNKGEGAWTSIDSIGVPASCRTVYAEAEKDACFGHAALQVIRDDPMHWLRLIPKKLEKTFDDVGAPGWYLNASSWRHFDERAKVALGVAEVLFQRGTMMVALVGLMRARGPGRAARLLLSAMAAVCLFYTYAWLAVLLFCLAVAWLGRDVLKAPVLLCTAFAYSTTALVHAAFFGGARYAIVILPFMIAATARTWSVGHGAIQPAQT